MTKKIGYRQTLRIGKHVADVRKAINTHPQLPWGVKRRALDLVDTVECKAVAAMRKISSREYARLQASESDAIDLAIIELNAALMEIN